MSLPNTSNLYLSPDQEDLLMAALKSNQPVQATHRSAGTPQKRPISNAETPASALFDSTSHMAPGSGQLDFSDESPYLDFDIDGDDAFNFDVHGQMIGDLPDEHTGDRHDKRKSIDDDDDDDEGGGKRREGEDKSGRKPGRKPLTSEPTSKRKAQNRAAQRAFRERKEKHLKDLETKVDELEKISESTNHENGLLKAQNERLQVELKEYRKRLSWVSSNAASRASQAGAVGYGAQARTQSTGSNDFHFEFPKFGDLPANNLFSTQSAPKQPNGGAARSSTVPNAGNSSMAAAMARPSRSTSSPRGQMASYGATGGSPTAAPYSASPASQPQQSASHHNSIDSLSGLFSPSTLEASRTAYFPALNSSGLSQNLRSGVDANNVPALYHSTSGSNTDSPSASSDSHLHPSSIATSPEPSLHSPSNKFGDYTLNTINESAQVPSTFGGNPVTPGFELNGIHWFAQQNGGAFDPELFGDYRESQDAITSQDFGTFFNDAFPLPDLGSPEHNFNAIDDGLAPKADLMKKVEAAREADDEMVPGEKRARMMSCNKIWDRLQSMEKFRNGEIDVDNLCSELRAKARCSEGGAVVHEKDVDRILGQAN